jgi:PAS domain S-box-containing protein
MKDEAGSAHLCEAIVEQMPDALIYADRQGVIRIWNGGAEQVFGFRADDAVGKSLDLIIPERLRSAHWKGFQAALDRGRTSAGRRVRTTRAVHQDGRKLYVDLSFGLVVDAGGHPLGAVAIGRDCTERFLAEKVLRDRLAELETVSRAREKEPPAAGDPSSRSRPAASGDGG